MGLSAREWLGLGVLGAIVFGLLAYAVYWIQSQVSGSVLKTVFGGIAKLYLEYAIFFLAIVFLAALGLWIKSQLSRIPTSEDDY